MVGTAAETGALETPPPAGPDPAETVAIVVPHTHWDREWYAPFEQLRFALVQFLDELVDVLEAEPDLPGFLLDGQVVILEDYLEVRRGQRDRVLALVAAGRLRPGPFYVQPDEFHVSGEGLVRNLLLGLQASREFGWVMREGYLPDTFGHVHQLPQVLQGFGIGTFYAMRGFGLDAATAGSEFWWAARDGSRVLVEWLTESYSNAAVLTDDPQQMALHHGLLVRYDSLPELLARLADRSRTGVLLLLNGGDHLRVQEGVPGLVRALNRGLKAGQPDGRPDGDGATPRLRLGGLEDFSRLVAERPPPELVVRGELRYGARHDVFGGIMSTRTPMKALAERTEAHLAGVAERLDALATLVDSRSSADALRYAWRELVKNYAHDSICGCSVDAVHEEMGVRFAKVGQVAHAVADDALARIAGRVAPDLPQGAVPVVVLNPSPFPRSGPVTVDVLPDLESPVGQRRYGWTQGAGVDWSGFRLLDDVGRPVPFTITPGVGVTVADTLDRRKELRRDRLEFTAVDAPPMGTARYFLTTAPVAGSDAAPVTSPSTTRTPLALQNGLLHVEVEDAGTLVVTELATGRRHPGLLELLDDGDAGDEYGFGPVPGDRPRSARGAGWVVAPGPTEDSLAVRGSLAVPEALSADRTARSAVETALPVALLVRLPAGADRVEATVTLDNRARDHRLRMRFPGATLTAGATGDGEAPVVRTLAESAYGVVRRDGRLPEAGGWREPPSGLFPLRRFVALEYPALDQGDRGGGLQVLTEGLYEYSCADGALDVTLLRAVGWLARLDHPLRPHKVGPELPTPGAQCLGPQVFRLAIRPYGATGAVVPGLYRAAEEFAVPLQAYAVQGHRRTWRGAPVPLGLAVTPQEVVLSALKTAEDSDGLVVRVFNSADHPVEALLRPAFPVGEALRCDLEEQVQQPLETQGTEGIRLPLDPGQIATVRLRPAAPAPQNSASTRPGRAEPDPEEVALGEPRGQNSD